MITKERLAELRAVASLKYPGTFQGSTVLDLLDEIERLQASGGVVAGSGWVDRFDKALDDHEYMITDSTQYEDALNAIVAEVRELPEPSELATNMAKSFAALFYDEIRRDMCLDYAAALIAAVRESEGKDE